MTPRSLIDAALEDQTRRILLALPTSIMGHSAPGRPPCRHCGGPIMAHARNGTGTGYCGLNADCRRLARLVAVARYQATHPQPSRAKIVRLPQFCRHCGVPIGVLGRPNLTGFCRAGPCRYQKQLAQAHGENVGTAATGGNPL